MRLCFRGIRSRGRFSSRRSSRPITPRSRPSATDLGLLMASGEIASGLGFRVELTVYPYAFGQTSQRFARPRRTSASGYFFWSSISRCDGSLGMAACRGFSVGGHRYTHDPCQTFRVP